ncbi:QRFP-like peptide receptor [Babylonia areolata]|uniref:QRFP-like peptide receptor n=1 Tax=Babylonia areolata TaxID=304850 RepID=UPI003FD39AED
MDEVGREMTASHHTDSAPVNGSDVSMTVNDSSQVTFDDVYGEDWAWGSAEGGREEAVALAVVYVPVMVVAVGGNVLLLGVVGVDRRMRRSAPNFFLCNLALADLLVGLFCIPITAVRYLYQVWVFGELMCKVTGYLQGISIVASVLTIVLMAADRYVAILRPMRNRHVFSVRRVRHLVVLTWLLAAVIVLPLLIVRRVEYHDLGVTMQQQQQQQQQQLAVNAVLVPDLPPHTPHFRDFPDFPHVSVQYCTEAWPSAGSRQLYDSVLVGAVYVLPAALTVALYTRIGSRLWAEDQTLARTNSSVSGHNDRVVRRRRLALVMVLVSVLFAVCWLPHCVVSLCLTFLTRPWAWLLPTYPFSLLLAHANSALNPLLYGLLHRGFQRAALAALRCQWARLVRTGTISSQQSERSQLQGSLRTSNRDSARRDVTPSSEQRVNAV